MYNIYYKGDICGNPRTYMGTTNNFKKWLEQHNKDRGNEVKELPHEFELKEVKESKL
jgi:predicted GIY-YIG superfamily endonuclease